MSMTGGLRRLLCRPVMRYGGGIKEHGFLPARESEAAA